MATRYRCSVGGTLGDGEVFSFGFSAYSATDATIGVVQGRLGTWLSNAMNGSPTLLKNFYAPEVKFTKIRTQALDPAGLIVDSLDTAITPIIGGSTSSPSGPYEVSMCVSLLSAISSRKSRGRMYLPPMHRATVEGNGRIAPAIPVSFAQQLKVAFDAFNDTDVEAVVFTKTTNPMTHFPITSLSIGDIPDAQRRRRNRQVEVRSQQFLA